MTTVVEFLVQHSAAQRSWGPSGSQIGFSEEARTRGFASLTFVRFAFVDRLSSQTQKNYQFWNVRKLESV